MAVTLATRKESCRSDRTFARVCIESSAKRPMAAIRIGTVIQERTRIARFAPTWSSVTAVTTASNTPTEGIISALLSKPTMANRHCAAPGWKGATDMSASKRGMATRRKATKYAGAASCPVTFVARVEALSDADTLIKSLEQLLEAFIGMGLQ